MKRQDIEILVTGIVAESLDRPTEGVRPHSSLMDDLGAESIDFLDIVFRLEHAFGLKISDEEIWRGELDLASAGPAEREEGIRRLKEKMPDFRWERLPSELSQADLPRLITVATIVDYLERTLPEEEKQVS